MEERKPGTLYVFSCEKPSIVRVDQEIKFQVDRDPKSQWTRDYEAFSQSLPRHERAVLSVVVQLLQERGERMTQTELESLAVNRPKMEIDTDYMKRSLSKAVKAGVLTAGKGRGSKGYSLPEWNAGASVPGNGDH